MGARQMPSDFINRLTTEIESNDCSVNAGRIRNYYNMADDNGKQAIDLIFVELCGWTLKTLLNNKESKL